MITYWSSQSLNEWLKNISLCIFYFFFPYLYLFIPFLFLVYLYMNFEFNFVLYYVQKDKLFSLQKGITSLFCWRTIDIIFSGLYHTFDSITL